jgi:aspartyl-tRNA synthetase
MKISFIRSATCGQLRESYKDQFQTLCGWVHKVRNLGSLVFVDLRDKFGLTQVVFDTRFTPEKTYELAKTLRAEDVISIQGTVALRESPNVQIPTGLIEIQAKELEVLSKAKVPPLPIADMTTDVNEELRLKYRYLDLRRGKVIENLHLRHKAMQVIRQILASYDFIEVATPILAKSTPEGSRDYLVPSRVHPGTFYALPQSPQLFKQLLMVGGLDRYFQIATCFRDEDLRADRQPEFQQIDVEMSFSTQEELFPIIEELVAELFLKTRNIVLKKPFFRMTHKEAMELYGCDKPDVRFGMTLVDISDIALQSTMTVFVEAVHSGGIVRGFKVEGGGRFSRKEIESISSVVEQFGFPGVAYLKKNEGILSGPPAKFFTQEQLLLLGNRFELQDGDLVLVLAGQKKKTLQALDQLRRRLGKELKSVDEDQVAPLWVTDFPLFTWNEEEGCMEAEHHPFTSPHFEDMEFLDTDPLRVRSSGYDLVINGYEAASGSQRIHDSELQEKIFVLLGLKPEELKERFGFFVEALQYGTPPHLGIGLGLDRLSMILSKTDTIRDVIAFPKNQKAIDLMMDAPSEVTEQQLFDVGIQFKDRKKN